MEHLATILRSALEACRLLEKGGRLRFSTDEFVVIANDRLNAPNQEATLSELRPDLTAALRRVFNGSEFNLTRRNEDPKERLTIVCRRS